MADNEQSRRSHEEWLEAERARLKEGFKFEPKPPSTASDPGPAEEILAGLGLGAGAVAGAVGPHPNPVTFEGGKAAVIVDALRADISDEDTRVQVDQTEGSVVVTVLESQSSRPYHFSPALSVTLIERPDALTVTVSDLSQRTVTGALSSIGSTLLDKGRRLLFRGRRWRASDMLDAAGHVMEGVGDVVEDVQDLGLSRRVWKVIDRVGGAAEEAYVEDRRKRRALEWKREAAVRAWTHCEWCGHAYGHDEADRTDCPTCGAPRGAKPASLE